MRSSLLVLDQLIAQSGLSYVDRSLYLWILAYGPANLRCLAGLMELDWRTIRGSCLRLEEAGWLKLVAVGKSQRPVVTAPYAVQLALCDELEQEYNSTRNRGEHLMKLLLDFLVAGAPYQNNARPGALTNPHTGRALELDRLYYREKVGFEFNATDHQQIAPPGDTGQMMQAVRARDKLKADLCQAAGIELVTVEAEHLLPDRMLAIIPERLPRRHLDRGGPLWAVLTRMCAAYAAKSAYYDRRVGERAGPQAE